MSRYRKIEVRTWSDEKFRSLSAIPASGQGLWFFLLTGPHTTAIPGLFRAGRAAMAEELSWDLEAFDEAFQEVSQQGMAKADFKAKLVWLPNAIRHNKPESPNVVRSWRVELDLLPECDLKRDALKGIREALEEVGSSYVEAFDEVLSGKPKAPVKREEKASGKAFDKPSDKASPNQEQEQEQEKNTTPPPASPAGTPDGFAKFWTAWPAGGRKEAKGKCLEAWKRAKAEPIAEQVLAHVERLKASPGWRKNGGEFIPAPLVYLNGRRWEGAEDGEGGAGAAGGVLAESFV